MVEKEKVRVRIAPSPSGFLHVGTARAALYNWLFARKHKGSFILRIEDTDRARSDKEMEYSIIEGLTWLGLDWDEGPYYQSERLEIYRKYAERLVSSKKAYYCYCTPEELAERRERAKRDKRDVKYDRKCLNLSEEEQQRFETEKRPKALRFLIPEGETVFEDLIHGSVKKKNEEIEDFVIMKSDGTPTYNLAVVVDDHEMGITHVIRGDDHIPNTPKQVLLYNALDIPLPKFAHLPLILGEDKSKLSKRHGAVSVVQYREDGFLSEVLFNFLALLGWSPGEDREIMVREEILRDFSLERITKKGAVFDIQKLEWMNGIYINDTEEERLFELVLPFYKKKGWFDDSIVETRKDYFLLVISVLKGRMKRLSDFPVYSSYFFTDVDEYEEKGVKKHFTKDVIPLLKEVIEQMRGLGDFSKENLEDVIRKIAEEKGVKPSKLIHPIRLAVSGMVVGPGLFEILEILGQKQVINRLTKAIKYITIL
jgi:nondiscriminating glutamyl-tRNA synthetase